MKHLCVRAEAIVTKLRRLDPTSSAWSVVGLVVLATAVAIVLARLDGITFAAAVTSPSLLIEYQTPVLFLMVLVPAVIAALASGAWSFISCTDHVFVEAYSDEMAPRRLRRYAAGRLRDLAAARGADAWAATWESRRANL
jgi:hypothetical protein